MTLIGRDTDNNGYICECESCGMRFHAYNNTVKCCKQRKTATCESCGSCYHYVCNKANDSSCPYCKYAGTRYKYSEMQSTCDLCGGLFMRNKREHANTCNALKTYTCKHCNGVFTVSCCKGSNFDYCSLSCTMKESKRIKESHMNQRMMNDGKLAFNTDRRNQTMLAKYGVTVPCKNTRIRQKAIDNQKATHDGRLAFNTDKQRMTMIQRYGTPTTLQSPVLISKYENTMRARYGAARPASVPEIENRILNSIIANNGHLFGTGSPISKINIAFANKLSKAYMNAYNTELDYEYEYNIDNSFYDLRLCKHDILIDLNPTVTHNIDLPYACRINKCTQPCMHHKRIEMDYHLNRSILAYNHGYNLIQIYDNDDVNAVIDYIISLCRGTFENIDYSLLTHSSDNDGNESWLIEDMIMFACTVNDGLIRGYHSYHGDYYDNFNYILRTLGNVNGYIIDFNKNTSNALIPDNTDVHSSLKPVLVHSEHDAEFNVDMNVYGSGLITIHS